MRIRDWSSDVCSSDLARSPASTCARKPTSGCCGSVEIFQYTAVPGLDSPYSAFSTGFPSSSTSTPDRPAPSLNAQPATPKLRPTRAPDPATSRQAIAGVPPAPSAFRPQQRRVGHAPPRTRTARWPPQPSTPHTKLHTTPHTTPPPPPTHPPP